jgi:hypothetical protein
VACVQGFVVSRVEISLSCCIWIYTRWMIFSLDSNQDTTTCFQVSILFRDFSSSQHFSSLVARFPAIQTISLSIHSQRSPLVIPTTQHNSFLLGISKSKKLYAQFLILHFHIILLASQHMKAASNRPHRSLLRLLLAQRRVPLINQPSPRFRENITDLAAAYTTPLSHTFQRYRLTDSFTDSQRV